MPDDQTPRHALPYVAAGQSQKHVTVNEALRRLDGLIQIAVVSRAEATPPATPSQGQTWILPTGVEPEDWGGAASGALVRWIDGVWEGVDPQAGLVAFVQDEAALVVHDGTAWRDLAETIARLSGLDRIGVGASASEDHPLVVGGASALFHPVAPQEDFRLTVNKVDASGTASLLVQSGFSGRAEVGCVGNNDLRLRISEDGADWRDALVLSHDASEARLFDHLVVGRTGGIVYATKPETTTLAIGPAGGATIDSTPFWRGVQVTAPALSFEGSPAYPRLSAYFTYDEPTDPETLAFALAIGNLPEGVSADLMLSPGGSGAVIVDGPLRVASKTIAALPSATDSGLGALFMASDASGGPALIVSDGTTWRRVDDGSEVD